MPCKHNKLFLRKYAFFVCGRMFFHLFTIFAPIKTHIY